MALSRATQQEYTIKEALKGVPGNAFAADGFGLYATIQPMSGTAAAQMYGLKPAQMRLMLFEGSDKVTMNQGVCVEVESGADPDFRIVYVEKWARHCLAHLKHIPIGERGEDE